MFRNYYHCLVAGLPELFLDETELSFSFVEFKDLLSSELYKSDYKLVQIIFLPYDNSNLLNVLQENYDNFDKLGNFTLEQLENELTEDAENILPSYMYKFVDMYKDENFKGEKSWENIIAEMYYEYIQNNIKNKFLSKWFDYQLNVENINSGINCRKYNIDKEKQVIGNNFVTRAILNSNAKDFGLEVDVPYVSQLISLSDKNNLLTKEKEIDKMKWNMIEELSLFDYFSIEVILAYLLKLNIAYRWLKLDYDTGKQMFKKIVDDLKSSYEFPKEFSVNESKK
ncbi:MAG: DUF2764 family protein [Bacteroidales bacterium]|jgi:hypothetical protein|nr:DUF2764 family protein [Bacteroidales bacterium]